MSTHFRGEVFAGGMPLRGGASMYPVEGTVYWVDPTDGSDGHDGKDPDRPFGTLQKAIDSCTGGAGDVIIRMPGTETVTSRIDVDTAGITIVAAQHGLAPYAKGEFFATLADASLTDEPVIKISERCTIVGLGFVSRDAGSTFFSGAAMLIGGDGDADPFGVHILGCRFPKWNVSNRIGVAVEGSTNVTIERCDFEGVGSNLEAGVYVQGATQNLNVLHNHFRQCDAAVETGAFAGGGPHVIIGENVVEDGKLLDTGGNSGNGIVYGNWLETDAGTDSYDRAVATLQGDGWQFSGNNYSE